MLKQNYTEIYMEEHQNNKFRYERKFIIQHNFLTPFLLDVFSSGFTKAYSDRKVNNIYLDDYSFSSLNHNFDGLSKREKYRIRWYEDSFNLSKKTLEIKTKNEFLNTKTFFEAKPLQLKCLDEINDFYLNFKKCLFEKNDSNQLLFIKNKRPTLFNSYKRMYFENHIKGVRLTIDKELIFHSPITKVDFTEKNIIVEIKYNKEISFINNLKKLSFTRYSKYVKGTSQTTFSNTIY